MEKWDAAEDTFPKLRYVIKSDTKINVLEIDFFYQVANALCITLVEPLGLTA